MKLEQQPDNTWTATGIYRGWHYSVEGQTRDEARLNAMLAMADIQAEQAREVSA